MRTVLNFCLYCVIILTFYMNCEIEFIDADDLSVKNEITHNIRTKRGLPIRIRRLSPHVISFKIKMTDVSNEYFSYKYYRIESSNNGGSNNLIYHFICTVAVSIVLTSLFVSWWEQFRVRRKLKKIEAEGLVTIDDKNPSNYKLNIKQKDIDLALPCHPNFQIPKNDVTIAKDPLGKGAWGYVYEATVKNILINEDETRVAIKSAGEKISYKAMRTLVNELEIYDILGRHVNVVGLLGGITNLDKGEMMIIVEYCPFGNILNFLRNNRGSFIDQIDFLNDVIDENITKAIGDSNSNAAQDYGTIQYSDLNLDIEYTGKTRINDAEQKVNLESSSEQSESVPFTTTDLLCFAYQVTRGMQYIASKNIVHCDLAARNILLCANNVVKICDFGLARKLDESGVHKKYGTSLNFDLPMQWLAPESIKDYSFSLSSDVWSYGIMLWELFTLGKKPNVDLHNHMEKGDNLYKKLVEERYKPLEKPEYATEHMYDTLIRPCWKIDPKARPSFEELEKTISEIIGNKETTQKYIDMNKSYEKANETHQFIRRFVSYAMKNIDKSMLNRVNVETDSEEFISNIPNLGPFNLQDNSTKFISNIRDIETFNEILDKIILKKTNLFEFITAKINWFPKLQSKFRGISENSGERETDNDYC